MANTFVFVFAVAVSTAASVAYNYYSSRPLYKRLQRLEALYEKMVTKMENLECEIDNVDGRIDWYTH